jgi:N6-L-threonylcarbamoyladenine synthase
MSEKQSRVIILGIESSCDETSAAVIINDKLRSNITATQTIHAKYGGVIPEVASRNHLAAILPVVKEALSEAGVSERELTAIAVTQGPGLLGALLVGFTFAKSLAWSLNIPLFGVNHLEAHVAAHYLTKPTPEFPFLCLLVSGGHTQLLKVTDYQSIEILGQTIDDAAGEAFDKTAKLLGFDYPGGPFIDKYAQEGNPIAYQFSVSKVPGFNFSFSGFKTAVLYFLNEQTKQNNDFIKENLNDLCASIQHAIVSYLTEKLLLAVKETGIQTICIAGGVSANSGLREALKQLSKKENLKLHIPPFEYCTDNAAMIAQAGLLQYQTGKFLTLNAVPYTRVEKG